MDLFGDGGAGAVFGCAVEQQDDELIGEHPVPQIGHGGHSTGTAPAEAEVGQLRKRGTDVLAAGAAVGTQSIKGVFAVR
ncbi:hypothetical protein GCM10009637_11630 [Brevibacterium luteolum]